MFCSNSHGFVCIVPCTIVAEFEKLEGPREGCSRHTFIDVNSHISIPVALFFFDGGRSLYLPGLARRLRPPCGQRLIELLWTAGEVPVA